MSTKRTIPPSVPEMVNAQLKQQDYDGLWCSDGECACLVGDLDPAECMSDEKANRAACKLVGIVKEHTSTP